MTITSSRGIFLVLFTSYLVLACSSKGEKAEKATRHNDRISLSEIYQIKLKESSADYDDKKQGLIDLLNKCQQKYQDEIKNLELKSKEEKDIDVREIAEMKDEFYSKYGHDSGRQEKLDAELEKALAKKEKTIEKLNSQIKNVQLQMDVDSSCRSIKAKLDSLKNIYELQLKKLESERDKASSN
jgi:hypothetical protein